MILSALLSLLLISGNAFELKIKGELFDETATYKLSDLKDLSFEIDNTLVDNIVVDAVLSRGTKAVIQTNFEFSKTSSKDLETWISPKFKKNDQLFIKVTVNFKNGDPTAELFIFENLVK